ncbi:MAG: hypothetical protein ACRYHQ_16095 [Janthinobacterium lividum]
MPPDPETTRPELPPGFAIHNDGPRREVLVDPHDDEIANVFPTCALAAAAAWEWWRTIYGPDAERAA